MGFPKELLVPVVPKGLVLVLELVLPNGLLVLVFPNAVFVLPNALDPNAPVLAPSGLPNELVLWVLGAPKGLAVFPLLVPEVANGEAFVVWPKGDDDD